MLKKEWAYGLADGSLAAALLAGWCWHTFRCVFNRLEWLDWVAYALPAANWVERGRLSTPQLGPQFHFDRTWLFNSPMMGAGPAPFYWLLGTGRVGYLVGVAAFALVNLAAFAWVIRRALRLRSVALSLLGALAFVGHRIYLTYYWNQRYDLIAFTAVLLAFVPVTNRYGKAPAWRWGCAGVLPLLHPALVPASLLWLAAEVVLAQTGRLAAPWETPTWAGRLAGPVVFAATWGVAAGWYGRPEGLETQFLPHVRFHSAHAGDGSQRGRVFETAAALPFSVPTGATTLLIVATAAGLGVAALARRRWGIPVRVLIPAGLIAGVVVLDLARGFGYWGFYLLGLAPCLLFAFGEAPRARRIALAVLVAAASAQVAVALRLDRSADARLVGQREAVAFIVGHTRPGEALVVGPPFVLASAPPSLPGDRRVVRVVPQPFYLIEFDRNRDRADIADHTTAYLGDPRWFTQASVLGGVGRVSAPLYEDAEIQEGRFFGEPVIVARRGKGSGRP